MTEAKWLAAENPQPMLHCLQKKQNSVTRTKLGRRKLRLFACGCCRQIWHLLTGKPDYVAAIEMAEQFADGLLPARDLTRLRRQFERQIPRTTSGTAQTLMLAAESTLATDIQYSVVGASSFCSKAIAESQNDFGLPYDETMRRTASLFRCVFGNPFRPVGIETAWRTSTVLALVHQMYDTRDFSAMPILADALQDAGCDNEAILNHCRDEGQVHVRGCWVVDLVLGKE